MIKIIERDSSIILVTDSHFFKYFKYPSMQIETLQSLVNLDRKANLDPVIISIQPQRQFPLEIKNRYGSLLAAYGLVCKNLGVNQDLEQLIRLEAINLHEILPKLINNLHAFHSKLPYDSEIDPFVFIRKDLVLIKEILSLNSEFYALYQKTMKLVDVVEKKSFDTKNTVRVKRIHGDFDLSQVVFSNKNLYIIDFNFRDKFSHDHVFKDLAGIYLNLLELHKEQIIPFFLRESENKYYEVFSMELLNLHILRKYLLKVYISMGGYADGIVDEEMYSKMQFIRSFMSQLT